VTGDSRYNALRDLVSAKKPIAQTVDHLRTFPWDSDRVLVVLRRADAVRVLRMYLQARVSGEHCVAWANAIESRDDIGFERAHSELLKQFIFELANPELSEPLSHDTAHRWLRLLEDAESAHSSAEFPHDDPDLYGGEP
jgi:hypothetical protein